MLLRTHGAPERFDADQRLDVVCGLVPQFLLAPPSDGPLLVEPATNCEKGQD